MELKKWRTLEKPWRAVHTDTHNSADKNRGTRTSYRDHVANAENTERQASPIGIADSDTTRRKNHGRRNGTARG